MLILFLRCSDGVNIFRYTRELADSKRVVSACDHKGSLTIPPDGVHCSGKLNIIDLASNDESRKPGSIGRMTETCQINTSLFSLSNVRICRRTILLPCHVGIFAFF